MIFAKAELRGYDTDKVCRMIEVSRSEYYRKNKQTESERSLEEKEVINCFNGNHGNYGRIRIRKALLEIGLDISEYRIARILSKNGLFAKSGRSGKHKVAKPTEEKYIEENLIRDKFSVKEVNYLWCSDITELAYKGGKMYVCGIIDVATRRLVGWSVAKHQRQELVQCSIRMAVGRNTVRPEGAVFHSDRGCQYTAKKTKELVESYGFRKSMSRPGTPSDNQPIESFWHTLEVELPSTRGLAFSDAARTVVNYIELYYNSERIHSGIDYCTPNQFLTLLSVH